MKKYDIFISYRREDGAEFAEGLYMALRAKGYKAFFDKKGLRVGTDYPSDLSRALNNATEFVSVVSPSYCGRNRSGILRIADPTDWVRKEISVALSLPDMHFFPIAIDCAPPKPDSLPSDIRSFADKNFITYDRAYDTYEKIVNQIDPLFCDSTKENALIGFISERLSAVDVHNNSQFNIACKDITKLLDDNTGEQALFHILQKKQNNLYQYSLDYRFVVFYTLFSHARRNHQAARLISLVESYGEDFAEYSFMQYVYVEFWHTKYQLELNPQKSKDYLISALGYAKKAVSVLPENNGILHCYALSVALASENGISVLEDDFSLALSLIGKIIESDPQYALYYCTFARLLACRKEFDYALLNLKRAQALERPGHNDWVLRISDYRRQELIIRMKQMQEGK